MSSAPSAPPSSRVPSRLGMHVLGLGTTDEAIYRALLREPGLTSARLGQQLGLPAEALDDMLAGLKRRGLVLAMGQEPVAWEPTNPEVAIELLLMERQLELHEARRLLPELREELARQASRPVSTDIQVLAQDPVAQLQAYLSLFDQARQRIDLILRPPFLASSPDAIETARASARRRGVRIRIMFPTEVLQWHGWQAAAAQSMAAGDEIRVLEHLPFKLIMADGRSALLPLRADDPDGPALKLGHLAVVHALDALFEQLWEQAVAIDLASAESGTGHGEREAAMEELITVLASGANDKTAAHVLGVSDRTLQRRLGALTAQLRAKSRFQAGWLAALRRRR